MRTSQFVVGCLAIIISLLTIAARADQAHAVVLQYQLVAHDPAGAHFSPSNLQRQVRYLRENRYRVLPLPELLDRLRGGQLLPDRSVALTFDDAARSVCDTVFPLLRRANVPFTVFVSTDVIDRKNPAYCSWEQLREMASAGVTLANHTAGHLHLPYRKADQSLDAWRARVLEEIERGERRLAEETGQSHRLLAWPFGEFNEAVKQIARDAGYIAFGQQPGPFGRDSDWLELPRFPIAVEASSAVNLSHFGAKLQTVPFPLAAVHRADGPLAAETGAPSLELVLRETAGRLKRPQLQCYTSEGKRIGAHWLSETRFRVKAYRPLPLGRAYYHCTLPQSGDRFYWYSQAWITADSNGRWPD